MDEFVGYKIPKNPSKDHLLQECGLKSREGKDFVFTMNSSFYHHEKKWKTVEIKSINNPSLQSAYRSKTSELKKEVGKHSLLETHLFLLVKDDKMCTDVTIHGPRIGISRVSALGDCKLGVNLCRHGDLLLNKTSTSGELPRIIMCKVTLGRTKRVPIQIEERGLPLEPTPNHECHISATKAKPTDSTDAIFKKSLVYLYEYNDDGDVRTFPRQCLPVAILTMQSEDTPYSGNLTPTDRNPKNIDNNKNREVKTLRGPSVSVKGSGFSMRVTSIASNPIPAIEKNPDSDNVRNICASVMQSVQTWKESHPQKSHALLKAKVHRQSSVLEKGEVSKGWNNAETLQSYTDNKTVLDKANEKKEDPGRILQGDLDLFQTLQKRCDASSLNTGRQNCDLLKKQGSKNEADKQNDNTLDDIKYLNPGSCISDKVNDECEMYDRMIDKAFDNVYKTEELNIIDLTEDSETKNIESNTDLDFKCKKEEDPICFPDNVIDLTGVREEPILAGFDTVKRRHLGEKAQGITSKFSTEHKKKTSILSHCQSSEVPIAMISPVSFQCERKPKPTTDEQNADLASVKCAFKDSKDLLAFASEKEKTKETTTKTQMSKSKYHSLNASLKNLDNLLQTQIRQLQQCLDISHPTAQDSFNIVKQAVDIGTNSMDIICIIRDLGDYDYPADLLMCPPNLLLPGEETLVLPQPINSLQYHLAYQLKMKTENLDKLIKQSDNLIEIATLLKERSTTVKEKNRILQIGPLSHMQQTLEECVLPMIKTVRKFHCDHISDVVFVEESKKTFAILEMFAKRELACQSPRHLQQGGNDQKSFEQFTFIPTDETRIQLTPEKMTKIDNDISKEFVKFTTLVQDLQAIVDQGEILSEQCKMDMTLELVNLQIVLELGVGIFQKVFTYPPEMVLSPYEVLLPGEKPISLVCPPSQALIEYLSNLATCILSEWQEIRKMEKGDKRGRAEARLADLKEQRSRMFESAALIPPLPDVCAGDEIELLQKLHDKYKQSSQPQLKLDYILDKIERKKKLLSQENCGESLDFVKLAQSVRLPTPSVQLFPDTTKAENSSTKAFLIGELERIPKTANPVIPVTNVEDTKSSEELLPVLSREKKEYKLRLDTEIGDRGKPLVNFEPRKKWGRSPSIPVEASLRFRRNLKDIHMTCMDEEEGAELVDFDAKRLSYDVENLVDHANEKKEIFTDIAVKGICDTYKVRSKESQGQYTGRFIIPTDPLEIDSGFKKPLSKKSKAKFTKRRKVGRNLTIVSTTTDDSSPEGTQKSKRHAPVRAIQSESLGLRTPIRKHKTSLSRKAVRLGIDNLGYSTKGYDQINSGESQVKENSKSELEQLKKKETEPKIVGKEMPILPVGGAVIPKELSSLPVGGAVIPKELSSLAVGGAVIPKEMLSLPVNGAVDPRVTVQHSLIKSGCAPSRVKKRGVFPNLKSLLCGKGGANTSIVSQEDKAPAQKPKSKEKADHTEKCVQYTRENSEKKHSRHGSLEVELGFSRSSQGRQSMVSYGTSKHQPGYYTYSKYSNPPMKIKMSDHILSIENFKSIDRKVVQHYQEFCKIYLEWKSVRSRLEDEGEKLSGEEQHMMQATVDTLARKAADIHISLESYITYFESQSYHPQLLVCPVDVLLPGENLKQLQRPVSSWQHDYLKHCCERIAEIKTHAPSGSQKFRELRNLLWNRAKVWGEILVPKMNPDSPGNDIAILKLLMQQLHTCDQPAKVHYLHKKIKLLQYLDK